MTYLLLDLRALLGAVGVLNALGVAVNLTMPGSTSAVSTTTSALLSAPATSCVVMEEAMLPPKLNSLGTIRLGGAAVALAASACFETVRTSMSGVSEVACFPTASMSSQSDLLVPLLDADRRADDPGVIRASDFLRCLFIVDGASSMSEAPISSPSSFSSSSSSNGSICSCRFDGVGVGGANDEVGERDRERRRCLTGVTAARRNFFSAAMSSSLFSDTDAAILEDLLLALLGGSCGCGGGGGDSCCCSCGGEAGFLAGVGDTTLMAGETAAKSLLLSGVDVFLLLRCFGVALPPAAAALLAPIRGAAAAAEGAAGFAFLVVVLAAPGASLVGLALLILAAAAAVASFFFGASGGFVVVALVRVLPLATVLLCDAGTGATLLLWVSNCKG